MKEWAKMDNESKRIFKLMVIPCIGIWWVLEEIFTFQLIRMIWWDYSDSAMFWSIFFLIYQVGWFLLLKWFCMQEYFI
ncbi:hypothetical protein LCGC14_0364450 [marine sediment metagenome]|uniref:Uncharacterized protein n=1 Tax=marine sediment metagenome TaxID=412755 RepID=A0A0F9WF98_9ZZZZ